MLKERLQNLIDELKITPYEFAKRIGKSTGNINDVLKGRNKQPRKDFFDKIFIAFPDVNPAYLISGQEPILCQKKEAVETYDLNEIIKNICEQVINEKITPEFIESVLTHRMNNINSRTSQEFVQNLSDGK